MKKWMKVFFVLLTVVSLVGCSSSKTTEKTKKTKTLKRKLSSRNQNKRLWNNLC